MGTHPPRPCRRGHTSGPAQERSPETRLNPGWGGKRLSRQMFSEKSKLSNSSYLGEQAVQWMTSGLEGNFNRRQFCSRPGVA